MRSALLLVACLAVAAVTAKTPSSNVGQGTLAPQPQVIQESTVEYLPANENAAPQAAVSQKPATIEGTTPAVTTTQSSAPAPQPAKSAESSGEVEIVDSLPHSSVRPSGSTGGNAQEVPQSAAALPSSAEEVKAEAAPSKPNAAEEAAPQQSTSSKPHGSTGGNGEEVKSEASTTPSGGSGHSEESKPQAAPSKPEASNGSDDEVEEEGSDDDHDVEAATMNDEAPAAEQQDDDDSDASLDALQKEVLGADEADPFEREVDQESIRSDRQMERQRQQWKDQDAQLVHTQAVSKQTEKLSDDSESARQAVKLVFKSTVNRLKKEHAAIEKDLKKSKKEDAEILENLKQRLAKSMKEEALEHAAAASAAKPHPATHSHRFSGEAGNATEESDRPLTPAQVDRDEAQMIHRERTVAYYGARHIRGGAIGALKRAKKSFDAAKLAWESIQEVRNEDPENFNRYKKKYTVAKYNFEDATALLKKAKENVAQKGKLLKNAIAVLKDAKLKAACDDHPCTNTSTVCVADAKHRLLRRCAHACHDFDEDACGADGHCVAINHKPVCAPVCAEDACAQETYNTRCASIKRQPVCVNPCHYFNGDEVCDKVGGLKCIPTHNATNYYIRCKDLCTDQTCAKEAVDTRCEMFKGKPVCVDPCAGVKCHGSEKCTRIREFRPDLGDRTKFNVIGVCKPLCPEDGPNPCAKFFNTTGKSRCVAVKNQRFCVDPCYNVTDCPKGTQCARAGTSLDKHVCNKLCPSDPQDGEYPCPPKFAHLQQNTQCVVTDDGHHFVCKNPCKKADGHNPCPTGFKCTPNPTTPEFLRSKKYYSCAPACNVDSCKEEPLTFCRAPKHEPICTHPCNGAAKEDCHIKGPTIGCVPYVRKTELDKPYRCVDVCQDGGPCRTRKNNTQCYRDASGQAACRDPCAKAPADICDVEQVCVPNGRERKGFKCVMACSQYPCTGKDEVCVSDNTVPIYKRRCTRYPNAKL